MRTNSSSPAVHQDRNAKRIIILAVSVVSVVLAAVSATYFTHSRLDDGEHYGISRPEDRALAAKSSYSTNTLFQTRIVVAYGYLTLIEANLLKGRSVKDGLLEDLAEMRQRLAAIGEYGVSKEETERFWKNYGSFLSQERLQEIELATRTMIKMQMALLGAAFIDLYRQDFSEKQLRRLDATINLIDAYRISDVKPSETLRKQIEAALFLVQTEIDELSQQSL